MLKKYASIHIYDTEQEKNLKVLSDFYNKDKSYDEIYLKAVTVFNNIKVRKMF